MSSKKRRSAGCWLFTSKRKKSRVLPHESNVKIPPGFIDTMLLVIPRLKVCANCNKALSDSEAFHFNGSMSFINTKPVHCVLDQVYPEDWSRITKDPTNHHKDQNLCLSCISKLNKIYKAYSKLEVLLNSMQKSQANLNRKSTNKGRMSRPGPLSKKKLVDSSHTNPIEVD